MDLYHSAADMRKLSTSVINKQVKMYKKLYIRCIRSIRETSASGHMSLTIVIPETFDNKPSYNRQLCLKYIQSKLNADEYKTEINMEKYTIFISWKPETDHDLSTVNPDDNIFQQVLQDVKSSSLPLDISEQLKHIRNEMTWGVSSISRKN